MSGVVAAEFQCLLCEHEQTPRLIQNDINGDRSGQLKAVQCLRCAHVQLSPTRYDLGLYEADGQITYVIGHYGTPIETIFEHSAIEAERRVRRLGNHGETMTRSHGEQLRLLDVGGGYGFFGSAMRRWHPDVLTTVLEPSASRAESGRQHFAALADSSYPQPNFEVGLLDDEYVARHQRSYDAVTLWHVLEHVEDPLALLKRAGSLLRRQGGSLWIEVPNIDDELAALSPAYRQRSFMHEHLSYFSAATLERIAHQAFPGARIEVHGYQRYGIFNYFHWIQHNAPQGARPDMWQHDRWWLETTWRTAREAAKTSDALLMIVRFGQQAESCR